MSESVAGSPASGSDAASAMDCDSPASGGSAAQPTGVNQCSMTITTLGPIQAAAAHQKCTVAWSSFTIQAKQTLTVTCLTIDQQST